MPAKLTPQERFKLINRVVEGGEKVSDVCREVGISRVLFYRWLKRYEAAPEGQKLEALWGKKPKIERYWRQTPEKYEKAVLNLVIEHPELSTHKLVEFLPQIGGRPILSNHGVQNVLRRHHLTTFEKRLDYSQALRHPAVIDRFIHALQSVLYFLYALPVKTRTVAVRFTLSFSLGVFLGIVILGVSGFWQVLRTVPFYTQAGLTFALIALSAGSLFFLYSLKYYFLITLVLGFSRQVSGPSSASGGSGQGEENGPSTDSGRGFWRRVFGIANGSRHHLEGGNSSAEVEPPQTTAGGLQPDISGIKLERHPFVSIHLPMYNEKRVVERLLTACTSLDYENYEVIVVDDSTDETWEIVQKFAAEWNREPLGGSTSARSSTEVEPLQKKTKPYPLNPQPSLKIIHRETREGFKGGALRVALQNTAPQTEFVLIFDADFLPYPDTITQFLKYFQATAGGLDFSRGGRTSPASVMLNSLQHLKSDGILNQVQDDNREGGSNIAAVQGYQWHVLNKSENWVTRGVRSEYAGSYVVERSGGEILGALKQIAGSVYLVRKDILDRYGWGTSLTEDFELTLKLYRDGFKVVYTPYIQTPSECVATLGRLTRQRMRWAEGHSHNIRRMFWQMIRSSKLTFGEKVEFLYLAPYYLQATLFLIGTFSWLLAETVFGARLPFWTSIWGWSLVLTNLCALPLMNTVGLFLEESEERDYFGILSFLTLSYLLAPFQGYAAVKGFLERGEGPWFRTPKTGKITDIFTPGRFYRWLAGILPGRSQVAPAHSMAKLLNGQMANNLTIQPFNHYLSLATASNRFNSFSIRPKRMRWIGKLVLAVFLVFSVTLFSLTHGVPEVLATNWTTLYLRNTTSCTSQEAIETSAGSSTVSVQFNTLGQTDDWYSPQLPTGNDNASTGAGPYTFTFEGSWDGTEGGANITINAKVRLVDASDCVSSPTTFDSSSVQYKSNVVPPQNHTITLTNNANVSITSSSPKRIHLQLEATAKNKDGAVTLRYNNSTSGNNSRLAVSGITIPERLAAFLAITPFIPMIALWMKKKRIALSVER